eukprot:m.32309 g.32309  ORF g.32309 m.32309 type:complete len:620 (+) comp9384_c1_seq1:14-1873(+)
MATTLLTQIESAVAAVQREAASNPDTPLTDSNEAVSDFCVVLERVFNQAAKSKSVLGDKRDVWNFLSTALEKSAVSSTIRKIQSSGNNRTTLGKARSFVRACLVSHTLGSAVQEALQKKKLLEQFYASESIFRVDALALRLVDALYHLSEVEFAIDETLCVDEGWPSFQSKEFTPTAAMATRGGGSSVRTGLDDETSLREPSLYSVPTTAGPGSELDVQPDLLRVELHRVRTELAQATRERDEALREKNESDNAWAHALTSAKDKNAALSERLEAVEKQLRVEREKSEQLRSAQAADTRALEDAKARIAALELPGEAVPREKTPTPELPPPPPPAAQVAPAPAAHEIERELQGKFQPQLDAAVLRARQAEESLERAQEEWRDAKAELQAKLDEQDTQLSEARSTIETLTQRCLAYEEDLKATRASHDAKIAELEDRAVGLARQAAEQAASMQSRLNEATRAEAQHQETIAKLRVGLQEEAERTTRAEATIQQLQEGLTKMTQDKFRMWNRADQLNDIASHAATTATGWEQDDTVDNCRACKRKFDLFTRKHHCRSCGRVFCNACSSKSAKLSSSKDPVRVCEPCFTIVDSLRTRSFTGPGTSIQLDDSQTAVSQEEDRP